MKRSQSGSRKFHRSPKLPLNPKLYSPSSYMQKISGSPDYNPTIEPHIDDGRLDQYLPNGSVINGSLDTVQGISESVGAVIKRLALIEKFMEFEKVDRERDLAAVYQTIKKMECKHSSIIYNSQIKFLRTNFNTDVKTTQSRQDSRQASQDSNINKQKQYFGNRNPQENTGNRIRKMITSSSIISPPTPTALKRNSNIQPSTPPTQLFLTNTQSNKAKNKFMNKSMVQNPEKSFQGPNLNGPALVNQKNSIQEQLDDRYFNGNAVDMEQLAKCVFGIVQGRLQAAVQEKCRRFNINTNNSVTNMQNIKLTQIQHKINTLTQKLTSLESQSKQPQTQAQALSQQLKLLQQCLPTVINEQITPIISELENRLSQLSTRVEQSRVEEEIIYIYEELKRIEGTATAGAKNIQGKLDKLNKDQLPRLESVQREIGRCYGLCEDRIADLSDLFRDLQQKITNMRQEVLAKANNQQQNKNSKQMQSQNHKQREQMQRFRESISQLVSSLSKQIQGIEIKSKNNIGLLSSQLSQQINNIQKTTQSAYKQLQQIKSQIKQKNQKQVQNEQKQSTNSQQTQYLKQELQMLKQFVMNNLQNKIYSVEGGIEGRVNAVVDGYLIKIQEHLVGAVERHIASIDTFISRISQQQQTIMSKYTAQPQMKEENIAQFRQSIEGQFEQIYKIMREDFEYLSNRDLELETTLRGTIDSLNGVVFKLRDIDRDIDVGRRINTTQG